MSALCQVCSCADCTAWRAVHPDLVAVVKPAPTTPTSHDLQEALRSLVAMIRRQGGYATPEDQIALWRAENLLGLR